MIDIFKQTKLLQNFKDFETKGNVDWVLDKDLQRQVLSIKGAVSTLSYVRIGRALKNFQIS